MRARLLAGAVASAAALAACRAPAVEGTGTAAPEGAVAAADTTARGVVYVAGADPLPTVALRRDDGGAALALTGPLSAELRRLSGTEVEVRGTPGAGGPGPRIEVREYTILAIDGRRPRVGVLSVPAGGGAARGTVQLAEAATGATVTVADPDGVLARLDGAKVWLLLEDAPAAHAAPRVQSYGVVREASR